MRVRVVEYRKTKKAKEDGVEIKRIAKNGIPIYGYCNPALHSFYISLFLKSGSMYERDGEDGITHFLEHALVRNVNKLENYGLYSELDRLAMDFNASTYSEMVQFYISGATKHFSRGAELICRLFSPIILSADEVSTERKRIKAELREADERGALSTFSAEAVFGGTALSKSIIGTNKSIDRITARRLEEYRAREFRNPNVFFYVTGSFTDTDMDRLCELVGECKVAVGEEHTNVAPVPEGFGKRDAAILVKNADYTMLRFTFDVDMTRVDNCTLDLIYDMLLSGFSSPFFIEMSEDRGLFYDISGATERYKNIATLHFTFEVKERAIYDAAECIVRILREFCSATHDSESLMKSSYVDNAYMLLDDPRELNFTFAYDSHVIDLGYESLDGRIAAYEKITGEDVRRAACQIFRAQNLTLTLKGNKKKTDVERLRKIILEL